MSLNDPLTTLTSPFSHHTHYLIGRLLLTIFLVVPFPSLSCFALLTMLIVPMLRTLATLRLHHLINTQ